MITVLSPAKNLNSETPTAPFQEARNLEKSHQLINKLKTYSKPALMKLMNISKDLALLNQQRYQSYTETHTVENSHPAIFMFNGDVYRGLNAESLDETSLKFANEHLRILSGLYGLLRPFDHIQPYRLEMGTKLPIRRKKNLYEFWGDDLTDLLNEDIKKTQSEYVINLASDEYWSSLDESRIEANVLKINFLEWRKGQFRFLSFNAKRARGLMTKYIMENLISDPSTLRNFNEENYELNEELSSEKALIFTRE